MAALTARLSSTKYVDWGSCQRKETGSGVEQGKWDPLRVRLLHGGDIDEGGDHLERVRE